MNDGIKHLLEYANKQRAIGREATSAELHGIAEVIDFEMRSLKDERDHWIELAQQWEAGASTRGFAERLEAAASERADVTIFGVDYVACPLDADGVPIHVGDVMEWRYGNGEFEVIGIGGNTLFYIDKDSNECEWTAAGDKRHHHAPTVEDVLREFTRDWCNAACTGDMTNAERDAARANVVAEYAAKLTLRGDE